MSSSSATSTDIIIYEKIKSKIAQNYECKMRDERDKTLLQIIDESIGRHQSRITFLQNSLSDIEETYVNLKSIYKEKNEMFEKFDNECDFEDQEEYYEELNTGYEIISANLVSRKTYINKEIKIYQEKLKKEIDDKDIIEFINKIISK
jgi:hypothetical protein